MICLWPSFLIDFAAPFCCGCFCPVLLLYSCCEFAFFRSPIISFLTYPTCHGWCYSVAGCFIVFLRFVSQSLSNKWTTIAILQKIECLQHLLVFSFVCVLFSLFFPIVVVVVVVVVAVFVAVAVVVAVLVGGGSSASAAVMVLLLWLLFLMMMMLMILVLFFFFFFVCLCSCSCCYCCFLMFLFLILFVFSSACSCSWCDCYHGCRRCSPGQVDASYPWAVWCSITPV